MLKDVQPSGAELWGREMGRQRDTLKQGQPTTALPSILPFPNKCQHQMAASLTLIVGVSTVRLSGNSEKQKENPLTWRAYT